MNILDRIKQLKIISKILIFIWGMAIVFMSTHMKTEIFELGTGFAIFCYFGISLYFWGPVILIERKKKQGKKTRTILGPDEKTITDRYYDSDNSSTTEPSNISSSILSLSASSTPTSATGDARIQKRRQYFYQKYKIDVCNIETIDFLDGHTFEYFCADLLKINGFRDVEVTRGSGDQGADIIASHNGKKYAIQCKHRNDPYTTRYGNKPIQEVYTGKSFYGCDEGIVLTNGYFTEGGYNAAKVTGVRLWDRETLIKLLHRAGFNQTSTTRANTRTNASLTNEYLNHTNNSSNRGNIICEGIAILLDISTFSHFGITVKDFGINKDIDDQDSIELLFDIMAINGRRITADVDIVCNIYANERKLCTESHTIFSEKFRGRDSATVSFDKKNISKMADRIEMYCKEW